MEQLLKAYLDSKDPLQECRTEIRRFEVFIEDDEQQYEVEITNLWLDCGFSTEYVSVSDLLVFLYKRGSV